MKNSDDDAEWQKTRSLLKEHLTAPPLAHPDFLTSRVMEEINRLSQEPPRKPLPQLRWLFAPGLAALTAAALLTAYFLPREFGLRSESEFISQVVDARTELPQLSITQFRAPNERGVVMWIEGTDYIPGDQSVR